MSLVADYGDSSNSDSAPESDSENEKSPTESTIDSSLQIKLPTPVFLEESNINEKINTNSVFKNPFKDEETKKEALLQKHVKMVDSKNNIVAINGKKICWNYRKGRCRFGHNCKFAHDSDIQKSTDQLQAEKCSALAQNTVVVSPQAQEQFLDDKVENLKRKKRPGLTQGLVPGKKVMNNYYHQKKA